LIIKLSSGVGYKVQALTRDIVDLELAMDVELLIAEIIREDRDDLYGFINRIDLECFEKLITVSGVGSKMAMSALDVYTPEKLAEILATSDIKSLQAITGIGKKLASKIILELRGELVMGEQKQEILSAELRQALTQMGFKQSELSVLDVSKFNNISLIDQLKLALKYLNKQ
jgi:Holliday junction DNA helicase RuvA